MQNINERPSWQKADGSIDFSDLDDFDAPAPKSTELSAEEQAVAKEFGNHKTTATVARFPCRSCRGSGKFYSWSGRLVGDCFKCKGSGHTKTDPAVLQARRQKAAAKKERAIVEQANAVAAWLEANPTIKAWFERHRGNDFADSLSQALHKWGALTPNQLAAVEKSIARDAERDAERAAANAKAASDPNALDLSTLPSGTYAVPEGETRLKVRVSRPKATSKWAGYIFVDDGAAYGSRQKYGAQKPGGRYVGKIVEQLRAILADPREAVAAYGRLTGRCGVCGRLLEDEQSIAAGIGPVCAGKFGAPMEFGS